MHLAKIGALTLAAMATVPVHAAQVNIDATIDLATRHEEERQPSSPYFRLFSFPINGISSPIDITQGDSIALMVVFNGRLAIPSSEASSFTDFLSITQYPAQDGEVTTEFFDRGTSVASFSGTAGFGSTALSASSDRWLTEPLTFDSYTQIFTFTNPQAFQVTGGEFRYSFGSLAAPVPETSTWTLMIVGFAAAGAAMRYKRRVVRAVVSVA